MTQSEDSTEAVYVTRVHHDPATVDRQAWNRLLDAQPQPTPFMRHEYLSALHESGSAVPATGWAPQFITVEAEGELVAATRMHYTLRRTDQRSGLVHVHFPRIGYSLKKVDA